MKVSELIKYLQGFNPDIEVVSRDSDGSAHNIDGAIVGMFEPDEEFIGFAINLEAWKKRPPEDNSPDNFMCLILD